MPCNYTSVDMKEKELERERELNRQLEEERKRREIERKMKVLILSLAEMGFEVSEEELKDDNLFIRGIKK